MLKKKIFLTSAFAVCIACPAFAVDGNELIENGDTCNNTNLGTYEGTANVEAIWTIDPRTCSAGQSYDSTTNTCITCTAGNYCPGGTFNVNSQTNGLNTCPSGYALSESGASADTDCYRQCATTDVAHSASVSGGYYYGNNNQCSATSCASGWHLKEGLNLAQYANTQPTNSSFIIMGSSGTSTGGSTNPQPASYFGLNESEPQNWATDMGYYTLKGIARYSQTQGVHNASSGQTDENDLLTDVIGGDNWEGRHCWCKITDVRENLNSAWKSVNSPWIYYGYIEPYTNCPTVCLELANLTNEKFVNARQIWFESVVGGLATCEANNIALKWYNDNTEVVPANSAAEQCTYNETITIPTNEPQKTGYTFGGWKLRTTTQEP